MKLEKRDLQFLYSAMDQQSPRELCRHLAIRTIDGVSTLRAANGYIINQIVIKNSDLSPGVACLSYGAVRDVLKLMAVKKGAVITDGGLCVGDFTRELSREAIPDVADLDSFMNPINYGVTPGFDVIGLDQQLLFKLVQYAPQRIFKMSFRAQEKTRLCETSIMIQYQEFDTDDRIYSSVIMPVKIDW
jgi:hypothetical protein